MNRRPRPPFLRGARPTNFTSISISRRNLPPGARLAIGAATIEITATPHTGCHKFADRFGPDTVEFVNSPAGRQLRLRGVNARVLEGGSIRIGDAVRRRI
jgi:MOSC domain-containing protein YiiM